MNPRRVLLKLSGEALAGANKTGFDEATVKEVARQVKISVDAGVEVGIVIGGGNFWRGRTSDAIDRPKADQIGMLATIMNCIYVSEIFRNAGMSTQILTPFECGSMTELFSKDRANRYFDEAKLYFLPEEQAILIFQPIQALRFAPLKWRQIIFYWQNPLTAYMTVIQRQIPMLLNMRRFPFRRSSRSSLVSLI